MVAEVLEEFEPVAERLAQAKTFSGITLAVGPVLTMYVGTHEVEGVAEIISATPAMSFSAEILNRLARLGASFDADIYLGEVTSGE
jgi:hypothetical protein